MKAVLAASLCLTVGSLAVLPARAATFEGIKLEELNNTQQLRDMPEVYEREPNTRRYQLRSGVVHIPLGEAWITYNAQRNAFYLNKVPGQNTAVYFGPIPGDPFEVFQLEERFITQLRKDYAGDVSYRLDLMLRTGNQKLRERALRIMTAGLAPEVPAETRANHLPKFRELAGNLGGEDVAPLLAAIEQTGKRIEELTLTLPDSDYAPGNDELERRGNLQDWMKPGVPIPATAWGSPDKGLRAAAVYSKTNVALGEDIRIWLLVENVSDKEIRFGSSDVKQEAHPKILRADGAELQAKSTWYSGMSPILRHRLLPGERVTLARKELSFEQLSSTREAGFGLSRVPSGPGEFRVVFEYLLITGSAWSRRDDGLMHRTYPAKGEWSGRLGTAETRFVVTGQEKEKAAAPAAEPKFDSPAPVPGPTPAPRENGGVTPVPSKRTGAAAAKSIVISVLDAAGKPIPEFRVISGVKSSVSPASDPEIVNWQPHTLRLGGDGSLEWPMTRAYDLMALRVEADGYAPKHFAWLEKRNPHDIEFRLAEDAGLQGQVTMPDGLPATNAIVALAMVQRDATLEGGQLRHSGETPPGKAGDQWRWPRFIRTDDRGQFRLPAENDPTAALLVVHDSGVREMSLADFKKVVDGTSLVSRVVRQVQLQAWGRIEGRAQWGAVPGTNRTISLSIHRDTYGYPGVVAQYEKVATRDDGGFVFERVLPGMTQVSCSIPVPSGDGSSTSYVSLPGMTTHLAVKPGTNAVLLGGQGRTVTGRLVGRLSYEDVTFHFHPTAPRMGLRMGGGDGMLVAWNSLREGPMGKGFFRDGLRVNADGTFEIPAALPGDYQIFFTRAGEKAHLASGKFTVPAESSGAAPEAQSIGDFKCREVVQ